MLQPPVVAGQTIIEKLLQSRSKGQELQMVPLIGTIIQAQGQHVVYSSDLITDPVTLRILLRPYVLHSAKKHSNLSKNRSIFLL